MLLQTNKQRNNGTKAKLLCSCGGKIHSRPSDHQLFFAGDNTKILAVDHHVRFSGTATKLNFLWNPIDASEISMKYQLSGEDLDALVSLIDDDNVEHMMIEYGNMHRIHLQYLRLTNGEIDRQEV